MDEDNKKSLTVYTTVRLLHLEAPPRFELGNKGFADLCLTTWLWRHIQEPQKIHLPIYSPAVL